MIDSSAQDHVTPRFTFLLEEYKSLRQEVLATIAEARLLERFSLVGIAGVYTWLFSQERQETEGLSDVITWIFNGKRNVALPDLDWGSETEIFALFSIHFGWSVPVFIAFFGLFRAKNDFRDMNITVGYIMWLERKLAGYGWENYLNSKFGKSVPGSRIKFRDLSKSAYNHTIKFWWLLLFTTLAVFIARFILFWKDEIFRML